MVRSSAAVSNTSGAALQNKKTGKATKASSNSMKTRQSPVLPASHTPRNIRLVPTPSAGQKPRQGSAHRALDEDAPQGAPQRSPRVGHVANASAMLGAAETPAASKDATMAHDREMRAMRRKATKSAVHGGNKGKTHSFKKANVATRQRHFIGQPRKFN